MEPDKGRIRWMVALVVLAIVVFAAACGDDGSFDTGDVTSGDDTSGDDTAQSDSQRGDDDPSDDEDEAQGFGSVVDASVELSGTVEETYAPDPGHRFVAAGGCQGPQFGVQVQVIDSSIEQTILQLLASIDEDLAGGATGSFESDDISVELFEPGDIGQSERYRGTGTIEVTAHDAPNDLNARSMELTVTAEGLEGPGDETIDIDVDLSWVMGCT